MSLVMALSRKTKKNICFYMAERQTCGSGSRGDLKALRFLMMKNCSKFQKVWEKTSKSPIGFDCQHLFFDNARTCYIADGRNGVPNFLFRLPPCRTAEKIESAVVFESPLDQVCLHLRCGVASRAVTYLFGAGISENLVRESTCTSFAPLGFLE